MLFATFYDAGRSKVTIFFRCHSMRNFILVNKDNALPAFYPYLIGLKLEGINRNRYGCLGSMALPACLVRSG